MSTSNSTCEKVVFSIYILYSNIFSFSESSNGNVFDPSKSVMGPMRRRISMCTRALSDRHIGNPICGNNDSFAIGKLSLAFWKGDSSSQMGIGERTMEENREWLD